MYSKPFTFYSIVFSVLELYFAWDVLLQRTYKRNASFAVWNVYSSFCLYSIRQGLNQVQYESVIQGTAKLTYPQQVSPTCEEVLYSYDNDTLNIPLRTSKLRSNSSYRLPTVTWQTLVFAFHMYQVNYFFQPNQHVVLQMINSNLQFLSTL